MLKNPLRPPPDMQPFLSDGGRIAIVDERKLNGEIRILGLADQRITILPVQNWKWQFLSQISWAGDGTSLFALAQSASDGDSCARFKWQPQGSCTKCLLARVGFPALCRRRMAGSSP